MTFNWGHKLIIVFLVFGGGMSYLVYRSVSTNYDLVSKEYYKDELEYQHVIDGTSNANKLSVGVEVKQRDSLINIQFPIDMHNTSIKGTALFYCPVDARRDRQFKLDVDKSGNQQLSSRQFIPGLYIVKISWDYNNIMYRVEKNLTIN